MIKIISKIKPLESNAESLKGRFGTPEGVFTPDLVTILGVIMYLCPGWVLGITGLLGARA